MLRIDDYEFYQKLVDLYIFSRSNSVVSALKVLDLIALYEIDHDEWLWEELENQKENLENY